MLYDKWKAKNPQTAADRRRQSADTPRSPRPMLASIRCQSTFSQTTDCTTPYTFTQTYVSTSPSIQSNASRDSGMDSTGGYSFSDSLSRQSTVASIDEGVEIDTPDHGAAGGNNCFSTTTGQPITGSIHYYRTMGEFNNCSSGGESGSSFESFDSQLENDVMSSLSSCVASKGSTTSAQVTVSSTTPPCSHQQIHALDYTGGSQNWVGEMPPSSSKNSLVPNLAADFRDGRRASDNMMFDSVTFSGQLGHGVAKSKGITELNRTACTGPATHNQGTVWHHRLKSPYFGPLAARVAGGASASPGEKRVLKQRPPLPKRISLPDHYEFSPHKQLNLRLRGHVDRQIMITQNNDRAENNEVAPVKLEATMSPPPPPPSSTGHKIVAGMLHQSRLHQKRHNFQSKKMLRQASYQLAQTQSVMPEGAELEQFLVPTPLSPIEDASGMNEKEAEEGMDMS